MYAAGKIPGGFIKRESRPTDKAILTARQIDRPIRPLFPKGYMNEVQIVGTVLSVDHENAHDVLAMIGASAALTISEIPFQGPLGAVRVALIDGEYVVNPKLEEVEDATLDLVVSGTKDAIVMVEAGAKEVKEEKVVEALRIAHEEIKKLVDLQLELQAKAGKPKWQVAPWTVDEGILADVRSRYGAEIDRVTQIADKTEMQDATSALRAEVVEALGGAEPEAERLIQVKRAFSQVEKETIRRRIAVDKRRPDGRAADEIRPITCEVGVTAAHARQRPVHARPDAGPDDRHPGRRRRAPAHRRHRHRGLQALHPPLQLPALLRRRDRASCAAPSGATSATARSPSAPCCR